jgi:hypothetical protein
MLDEERRLPFAARLAIFLAAQLATELGLGCSIGIMAAIVAVASGRPPQAFLSGDGRIWTMIVGFWPTAIASVLLVWGCRRGLDRRPMATLGLVRPGLSALGGLGLGILLTAGPVALLIATGGFRYLGLSASAQTAVLYLSAATEIAASLARSPETVKRSEDRSVPSLNMRGILYPVTGFVLQIFPVLPKDFDAVSW